MAWQVPSWLQPPSEAERRQLEALEEQVRAKATSMLRKNVGMARMQSEAARLVQTGMDEPTARKKALLDNASLIFADDPEAVARIMQTEESNAIQERAAASLERWRNAQTEDRLRDSQFTPGFETATNPVTQQPETFFRTSPNSAQLVRSAQSSDDTADIKNAKQLSKLRSDLDAANKSGDADAIAKAKRELESFVEVTSPTSETVYDPTTGNPIIERGRKAGFTPAALVTRSEEALAGAVNAAKLGSVLISKLRPEDVGVLGKGGEVIVDAGLAQAFPGLANLKRVDSRTLLKMYKNDLVRSMKIDAQLTQKEQKEIEEMAPGEGWTGSFPQAIQKIKTVTREVADRSRFSAQRAGRPIPRELYTPEELMSAVAKGEISKEEAKAIAKGSPYRDDFDKFIPK